MQWNSRTRIVLAAVVWLATQALGACSSQGDDGDQSSGTGGAIATGGSGGVAAGSGGTTVAMTPLGTGGATPAGGSGGATPMPGTGGTQPVVDAAVATGDSGTTDPGAGIVCTAPALAPGDHKMMLEHDGEQREYTVHVPASYDGTKAVPLILDFHGWTSNPMEEQKGGADMQGSGWAAKSEAVGFIVVYPQGLDDSWNGGALCCGTSQSSNIDDQGFAIDVVNKMHQDACIDPKRTYVTGISNGGAMSHLLACKEAGVFAAAAPVSMGNGTTPCMPSRPISVVMFRGELDELVAYNGGVFPSAQADFDMWKDVDGCTGTPMMTHTYCETYTQCKDGVEVTLCSLPMAGHVVYDDDAEISVPDVTWEAFERQRLP